MSETMFTNKDVFLLYRFQEAHRRLSLLQGQLSDPALRHEIKDLSDQLALVIKETNLLQKEIDQLKTENQKLEDECKEYDFQLGQIEKTLYSGKISSPKELEQLQKRNAEYKNAKGSREERLINQLYLIEEQENRLGQLQEKAEGLKERVEIVREQETKRRTTLRAQAEKVKTEAGEIEKTLPQGLIKFYQRSAEVLKGIVVAPIVESTCGSCHVILSQAVLEKVKKGGGTVPLCESCGRGLFYPETSR